MYRGSWLPFSGSLFKWGRCTMDVLLMISSFGTARSNSNARTSTKSRAFILYQEYISASRMQNSRTVFYALDQWKSVSNASMRSSQEGHHVTPNPWDRWDRIWYSIGLHPAFRTTETHHKSDFIMKRNWEPTWIPERLRPTRTWLCSLLRLG